MEIVEVKEVTVAEEVEVYVKVDAIVVVLPDPDPQGRGPGPARRDQQGWCSGPAIGCLYRTGGAPDHLPAFTPAATSVSTPVSITVFSPASTFDSITASTLISPGGGSQAPPGQPGQS